MKYLSFTPSWCNLTEVNNYLSDEVMNEAIVTSLSPVLNLLYAHKRSKCFTNISEVYTSLNKFTMHFNSPKRKVKHLHIDRKKHYVTVSLNSYVKVKETDEWNLTKELLTNTLSSLKALKEALYIRTIDSRISHNAYENY